MQTQLTDYDWAMNIIIMYSYLNPNLKLNSCDYIRIHNYGYAQLCSSDNHSVLGSRLVQYREY